MKEIRNDAEFQPQSPEPSKSPRISDPSAPRTPRRRRVNLARAGVALSLTALLGLAGYAQALHAQWSRPMPLAHKVVTRVTALQIPAGHLERVFGPGDSLTHGDFSHLTIQTDTVYAGAPLEISAVANEPLSFRLPPQASVLGPAGPTIEFDQSQSGNEAMMTWRAVVPATAVPSVAGTQAGVTYASWYVSFDQPGKVSIPVSIGGATSTATVDVVALPPGAKVSAHMTSLTTLHPVLQVQDDGNSPAPVTLNGVARTLTPGQTITVAPGSAYVIGFAPRLSSSIAESVFQAHGAVRYAGTVTTHHRVSYRPERGPFRLPPWLIDLALALVAIIVALLASGFARAELN